MKWKLPKKIRVLTELYKVKVVKGLIEAHGCEGMLEPNLYLISIDSSLIAHPRALKRTFYHELGHAFAFESGLHEFTSSQALEQFCQCFSALICQLK